MADLRREPPLSVRRCDFPFLQSVGFDALAVPVSDRKGSHIRSCGYPALISVLCCGERFVSNSAVLRKYGMILFVKKPYAFVAPLALAVAIALTGCGGSDSSGGSTSGSAVEVDVPEAEEPAGATFQDGVLTTPDMTITVTDYRVIQPGAQGNEYGDTPVLAIWYDTTNLGTSDREVSPVTEFVVSFEAYQDNDPNLVNKLGVGMLPDSAFLDSQTAAIKPGGTVPNAVAYELSDLTTPVELAAIYGGDEVGRMTFNLN